MLARPIPVKQYRTRAMNALIAGALRKTVDDLKVDFQATVATWNHPVTFTIKAYYKGDNARVVAYTDDYVWNLLDTGTFKKYAHASKGFVPKTKARVIGSFGGAGKMLPSKFPTRGIQAREWTEVIADNNITIFNQRIVAAIYRGFQI